jgi:hypothetical protein
LALPSGAPIQSGALRVGVDQDDLVPEADQVAGDIGCEGRLADTALLVEESNGYHDLRKHRKAEIRTSVNTERLDKVKTFVAKMTIYGHIGPITGFNPETGSY